ncbi:MAG TPA: hypothetical protein VFJ10_09745 [Acidobacteriaceae bacterium]|nr:hypothetical protein [Acidobacteriaceae bacterium]
MKRVTTDGLWIAYVEHGPINGWPVILSHGFPYDVHAYDEVASILAQVGARVIAPYTRGFDQPALFPRPSCGVGNRPPAAATSSSLTTLSVWNARSSLVSIGAATPPA